MMEENKHNPRSDADRCPRSWRISMTPDTNGACSPSAFTVWEVAVVVIVILCSLSLVLPQIGGAREAARRMQCTNQLKQIGLAILNYEQANRVFPPGTICAGDPVQPAGQYDVWDEAAKTEPGFHGTSLLLRVLPYIEMASVYKTWDFTHGVGCNAENGKKPAVTEIRVFYCPARRSALRPGLDNLMMLDPSWPGGGTDYGGCVGRHAAFTNETGYNLCDATMRYEPAFQPKDKDGKLVADAPETRWGVFGRVNLSTKSGDITDGMSLTIMTGELQRITTLTPGSKDGWAIGGPATLFTTGALAADDGRGSVKIVPTPSGTPLNNNFWGSPGSEHSNTANFGMADGSVRAISTTVDPSVFALLGSMADASSSGLD
jgi:prepilin-type processing-associated H-X9-DG protein